MLIVCPSCATSYDVELASLPPQGRQVRCLRCRAIWHAAPARAAKLMAAVAAIAPERGVAEEAGRPAIGKPLAQPRPEALAEAASEVAWDETSTDEPSGAAPEHDQSFAAAAGEHDADTAAAEHEALVDLPNEPAEVEAPPIAPVDLDEGRPLIDIDAADFAAHAAGSYEDIETVAARWNRSKAKRRPNRWPLSRLQTGILALVIVNCVLVGWRSDVVRALPQTASFFALLGMPVNLRGLAFDGIATTTEQHEGVPILVVEGNIVNGARKVVDVPRLKFVVRNAARQEIYSWTAVPSRAVLPPGEAVSFHSRLASPPPDAHDVLVRFVNRRDVLAAVH
jgi:predicted Zn finger-like uncharacterized protein